VRWSAFDQNAPAQPQPTSTAAPDGRSQAFRPVEGGSEMQSGEKLLVEAYAAIWIILFAFLLLSWRRQKQVDRRVATLEATLQQARREAEKR
jgi:CcmD family protein